MLKTKMAAAWRAHDLPGGQTPEPHGSSAGGGVRPCCPARALSARQPPPTIKCRTSRMRIAAAEPGENAPLLVSVAMEMLQQKQKQKLGPNASVFRGVQGGMCQTGRHVRGAHLHLQGTRPHQHLPLQVYQHPMPARAWHVGQATPH